MLLFPVVNVEIGSSHNAVISSPLALVIMPEKVKPIYG
jgi:hypothetical protein